MDIALGIWMAEGGNRVLDQAHGVIWSDAVGDLDRMTAKYGPSVSPAQVRTLRPVEHAEPFKYAAADRFRIAFALLNPYFAAAATWAISKGGTDWTPWSTFRDGAYLPFAGRSYPLVTGHKNAARWNA